MATSGVLTFHACHNSGITVSELGKGTYDHIGFFGAGGPSDAIVVEQWNDSTWIVDASGNRDTSTWGELVNNKYIDGSGCSSSGLGRVDISAYQDEDHTASGTLLVRFRTSGNIQIDTYNAKLYAFNNLTGNYYEPPEYVTVMGFEINPSGLGSTFIWSDMGGLSKGVDFVDHSPATQYYENTNEHLWYATISAKGSAVGFLDDWDLMFAFQYA